MKTNLDLLQSSWSNEHETPGETQQTVNMLFWLGALLQ